MPRGRPHVCPYCNSTRTICKGWRITKHQGKRRIKQCKVCRRKFTPKNQKATNAIEEIPAETCTESNEAAGSIAVSKPDESDKPDETAEEPEAPPELDETPEMVPPPDEEWTL